MSWPLTYRMFCESHKQHLREDFTFFKNRLVLVTQPFFAPCCSKGNGSQSIVCLTGWHRASAQGVPAVFSSLEAGPVSLTLKFFPFSEVTRTMLIKHAEEKQTTFVFCISGYFVSLQFLTKTHISWPQKTTTLFHCSLGWGGELHPSRCARTGTHR